MKLIPDLGTVVWKSLLGFRAMHLALAAGIAAATAVIVGALVVGDSVRGSLRDLVVQRLGNIEHAMLAQRFFDPQILSQAKPLAERHQLRLVPLIILPSVAIELNRQGDFQRASQVQAIGSEHDFWQLAPAAMGSAAAQLKDLSLATDEVALNASLAQELGAEVGDEITIRLPKGTGVPADSPLGRKDDAAASIPRQRVVRILPDRSVADLDFRAGQQPNRNVFLPLAALADALEQTGRANAALAVHSATSNKIQLEVAEQQCSDINSAIRPQLEDYGLKLQRHTRVFPDKSLGEHASSEPTTIFDYFQITSDQLIIDAQSERALAAKLLPLGAQRAMSYLVNQISVVGGDDSTPPVQVTYSIANGLENWEQTAAPYFADESFLEPRLAACWVNSWLAERLNLKSGSRIQITFFKPETTDGQEIETTEEFVVAGVVPVSTPSKGYVRNRPAQFSQAPTLFNDPDLTPVVPGITDQDSISKWDLPFKLTRTIPKEDDEYWRDFRLTPKLFVRYNTAARFFGSRFGAATAFRVSARGLDEARLRELATDAMLSAKAGLGLQFMPLRQQQLKAASGTTPFDGLFLALSFFVILSALMLVALLFRLSIEQRSEQWGLLLATGFTHRRVRSLLLRESLVIIALGLLVGIGLGLGYARLMVAGLETWWVGAISRSFLEFGFTPISLLIGGLIGGSTSLVTIVISMWRLNRKTPLDLIRGRWDEADRWNAKTSKVSLAIAGFLGFGALGLLALGTTQTGMGQAGSFFGSGMLLLSAALVLATHLLKQRRSDSSQIMARRPRLLHLAWWTLTRNPWRSVLTLGLLAVASFLIASMSIFQLAPDIQGSGSFELMAESALPIYRDIGSARIREEMLGKEDFNSLRSASILCFRARLGEDASCNNLYQVAQPTILGVPEVLTQYQLSLPPEKRFQWAAASSNSEISWQNLTEFATGTPDNPIPVVIDLNTAAWSLHQGASLGAITRIVIDDREIYFKTVGLLSNSIMQGRLLISEANFAKLFPEQSGYRFFLIHAEDQSLSEVSHALENGWSDQGLDATSTAATLAKMLAVQNTYISAFQAIGALGLLLGTIGLAIVQVRSVLERRRELALLQAIGFSRSRVAHLLLLEALILLCGGLLIGVFSALVAIVPYMISSNPQLNAIEPLALLSIVLAVGLLASSIAILTALRQPLLSNLRQ